MSAPPLAKPSLTKTGSQYRFLEVGSKSWQRNYGGGPPYIAVEIISAVNAEGQALVKDAAGAETRVAAEDLFPTNIDQQPDCSLLFHLSEAALLANLLTRDALTLPYTTTGNVLTSINPCKPVPDLYSVGTMKQYVARRCTPAAVPLSYTRTPRLCR